MPLRTSILISYEEYQRLLKSEKQYKHFLSKKEESAAAAPDAAHSSSRDSADLGGAGTSGHLDGAGSSGLPTPALQEVSDLFPKPPGALTDPGPVDLNVNFVPPKPSPLVHPTLFVDTTDRIHQETKRDKGLPPQPMPDLNPPLAPLQPQGHQVQVVPVPRAAGGSQTQHPWYYIGPVDFSSDEESQDDFLDNL